MSVLRRLLFLGTKKEAGLPSACSANVRSYFVSFVAPDPYPVIAPDELVLGLVYGAGAEAEPFERELEDALRRYGYDLEVVHLSTALPVVLGNGDFTRNNPEGMRGLQDMGDRLRTETEAKDILAQLGVYLMTIGRRKRGDDRRVAWLLRSLKRPEEVDTLRQLYGSRFVLLGLYVPDGARKKNIARRRQRWANVTSTTYEDEAARDVRRDEEDRTSEFGQAVRSTFSRADFFVDGRGRQALHDSLFRFVRLVFGEPFEPPHRHEQAMYHAFTAGLRSTEMGRQVGAAIVDQAGDLVAVGANDVPAAGGGLYWSPDDPDHRDFAQEPQIDSNTLWQRRVARELLVTMRETGWLAKERATAVDGGFDVPEARLDEFLKAVKPTRFRSLTEFGRSVHAEMDAITTAARKGVSIQGATLVSTTFPCHNCTRHVVAAGISRVLYIHPYAKSLARDLHDDAVVIEPEADAANGAKVVLEQYVGVAPRVYPQFFSFDQVDRKDGRGRALASPKPEESRPRLLEDGGPFFFGGPAFPLERTVDLERQLLNEFQDSITNTEGLVLPITEPEGNEHAG